MRGTDSFIIDLARIAKRSKKNTAYNEILNFSDFVGSVSNNIVFDGHPASYYKKFPSLVTGVTQGHGSEAFANYFSLLGGKNSVFWRRLLEQYSPETMKKFDEIVSFINSNTSLISSTLILVLSAIADSKNSVKSSFIKVSNGLFSSKRYVFPNGGLVSFSSLRYLVARRLRAISPKSSIIGISILEFYHKHTKTKTPN